MNLLKIEWLKLKNYKPFYILSAFFVVGVFASNYISYKIVNAVKKEESGKLLLNAFTPYHFEHVWQTVSYVSGYVLIIPVLLIILSSTNEFSYKTHRQNIIDGWSREQFISVKLQMVLLMALSCTIVVILSGFVFGLVSEGAFSLEHFDGIGFFFLKALSYFMIALLFSVLIKKNFAVGLFFVYMYFENFISQILEFVSVYLKTKKGLDIGNIGDYLPMNASDALLVFPQNPAKSVSANLIPTDYPVISGIMAAFYLLLITAWIVRIMVKRDL